MINLDIVICTELAGVLLLSKGGGSLQSGVAANRVAGNASGPMNDRIRPPNQSAAFPSRRTKILL